VVEPEGSTTQLSSKLPGRSTRAGEIYRLVAANGGGTGSPLDRDPELVLDDWLDGIITLEDAADVYGVVIDEESRAVREEDTRERRDEAHASASPA
jgi:N-methylhydantoinase B